MLDQGGGIPTRLAKLEFGGVGGMGRHQGLNGGWNPHRRVRVWSGRAWRTTNTAKLRSRLCDHMHVELRFYTAVPAPHLSPKRGPMISRHRPVIMEAKDAADVDIDADDCHTCTDRAPPVLQPRAHRPRP